IFLATTIAQTSITIPDCGVMSTLNNSSSSTDTLTATSNVLSTTWITKATCEQRAGRTGRTCAGLCVRLFP
ncbi:unnamed protein product, partial [Amoebophrya sp. A120]